MVRRMADEVKPRAVSGEIMTGAAQPRDGRAEQSDDIIDADYISLPPGHSPAVSPPRKVSAPIVSAAPPAAGMDMLRRSQMAEAQQAPSRGGPLFWAAGLALVLAAFWVSGGHALVRGMPFIGAEAPRSALRISGVTSRVETSGVRPILLVDGETANDGSATEHLPPLEIAVTGNDGLITRYRLGTSGRPLAPGETFAFSSRLDAPKNGVKTVSVTFAE
jgi:hypothetical protein